MFGLALIAILGVMGGAIAYIGDKIGTKVGKKKLSLFGLRPKHTSIIVAVTTGILIAASTLTILTIASRDVRTALFGMEKLRAELTALAVEVNEKNEQLEANQLLLQAKEQEYSNLVSRTAALTNKLADVRTQLTSVIEQREQTTAALSRVQEDYDKAHSDLEKNRKDMAALEATKKDLDTRIAELSRVRDSLNSDVERLSEATARLSSGIKYLREGTVRYRANEVLATAIIDAPGDQTQTELLRILVETNRKLLQRIGKPEAEVEMLRISQTDFDNASKALQTGDSSMVVRIVTHGNTVLDEPVIAHLELYPNKQIFAKGETIARTAIDVEQNGDNIEQVVLQFLQQVNSIAAAKGMLPDPLQGTVGSISGAELFNTVSHLKKKGGIVQLSAVAVADTSVAGPLEIKFDMEHR